MVHRESIEKVGHDATWLDIKDFPDKKTLVLVKLQIIFPYSLSLIHLFSMNVCSP